MNIRIENPVLSTVPRIRNVLSRLGYRVLDICLPIGFHEVFKILTIGG